MEMIANLLAKLSYFILLFTKIRFFFWFFWLHSLRTTWILSFEVILQALTYFFFFFTCLFPMVRIAKMRFSLGSVFPLWLPFEFIQFEVCHFTCSFIYLFWIVTKFIHSNASVEEKYKRRLPTRHPKQSATSNEGRPWWDTNKVEQQPFLPTRLPPNLHLF